MYLKDRYIWFLVSQIVCLNPSIEKHFVQTQTSSKDSKILTVQIEICMYMTILYVKLGYPLFSMFNSNGSLFLNKNGNNLASSEKKTKRLLEYCNESLDWILIIVIKKIMGTCPQFGILYQIKLYNEWEIRKSQDDKDVKFSYWWKKPCIYFI